MGVVVGLVLGAGLLTIWRSAWVMPPTEHHESQWHARTRDLLITAGMDGVTPSGLIAVSGGVAGLTFVVVTGLTRSVPISLCFAILTGCGPTALVRARARRRRSRRIEAPQSCGPNSQCLRVSTDHRAASRSASIGSKTGWRTRSQTASWSHYA